MAVEFRCAAARGRPYARRLGTDAAALMRAVGLQACELSLSLVSDRTIRRLNAGFRGKDVPTDVLSFSQVEERGAPPPDPGAIPNRAGLPLGDVVISIDTALRQARELGLSPASRLRTLLIHGFLHLIGYDHERSAAAARRMFARERSLAVLLEGRAASGRGPRIAAAVSGPRARRGAAAS